MYSTLAMICILLLVIDIYKSTMEDIMGASVYWDGYGDTYIVNEEIAYIYEAPDSHSNKIDSVLYSDQVTKVQDEKMWLKVDYETQDGEVKSGWIRKIDLITYKEYEFRR